MSSGTVPLGTYHRANALGSGAYGSVVTVYDEDGNEFALKLFDDESEDEEEDDDDDYETQDEPSSEEDEDFQADEETDFERAPVRTLQLGTLREISILRILRHENAHPNISDNHNLQLPSFLARQFGPILMHRNQVFQNLEVYWPETFAN